MKSYSSREIIQIITADGWYFVRAIGDHHQYKHPTKLGRVTVTHPVKDIPVGTARSIFQQAGLPIPR
ncbi:type II toxin-antitoxin system HicA family toxin [Alicyclobacillus sp. SO9]|uniref:type II toxin-antitoxin system HicA family toxin n=1 Tax=Alicyclobacillus sp. SO9 TaxID=2665646 RepID=UPI0018E8944D|nr:type II toxin-antitoxin system HicA family toxin [Alicyclobacillus sp. SO9]QQE79598.1 type II toxin-antitoxin system HicA family toxin [Alicyclobacillus sp. SO9]